MTALATHRLKRLGERDRDDALAKAEQYRALNEPEEAESICRDVLDVAPDNQRALRLLGLALTDRFHVEWTGVIDEALAVFRRLPSLYERVYYEGVAWERCAKAQLARGLVHNAADSLERAMDLFAEAEAVGPKDVPEPILRWNRCVRFVAQHPELVDARERPRNHEFQHGD